jgi:catechol 2,3-dioxygenase-like lactoylglutathione lyase family enzyme
MDEEAMVKKRGEREPWMPASEYGRSLKALSVNLLVKDIARAVTFAREVLGATVVYADADFAVLRRGAGEWMLHADHTYSTHPLLSLTGDGALRGVGIELRLHDHDPDAAVVAAGRLGYTVLAVAADKPHGLREAYIADPDGYIWVPDCPLGG